jgi:hypothetical protein
VTIAVAPDGTARVKGLRRVGRILPTYATEDFMAALESGYVKGHIAEVDGHYVRLWVRPGMGYLAYRVQRRCAHAWARVAACADVAYCGVRYGLRSWWRRQLGYEG